MDSLHSQLNASATSKSADTTRFSISLKKALLDEFDDKIEQHGTYNNRSEAIRDLIRDYLVKEEWKTNEEVVGALIYLHDHHKTEALTKIQHGHHANVLSTMHIHLDEIYCVEVTIVRGRAHDIQELADRLKSVSKHLELAMTSTGKIF
ncbi:MAG: nickel-responsive transcriptional regulator NikR [Candidatus Heimdallarchaeota archaeon]